jgi:hypothetical protein
MSDAAGNISVVLSVNKASFSAAMTEAQRELDKFSGKAKSAGHSSVTSVQAVSASLRSLHGGFEQNLRSMERWVAQSKTATTVAQAMFPIVGAATFGFMIGELVMKVADFVEKANAMPKAIQMGFASMQLASQSSADSLQLTNDKLQNAIDKLQGKPTNTLAIEFDDAAIAADRLATSIEGSNNKLNSLLSANHLSAWAILTGKMGTADREGTIKYYGEQADSNGYDLASATSRGDKAGIAQAKAALAATQASELANLRSDLSNREANSKEPGGFADLANIDIDKDGIAAILQAQHQQVEEEHNASLEAQKQKLDDAKAEAQAAKAAARVRAEAAKEAARVVAQQIKAAHELITKAEATAEQGRIDNAIIGPSLLNGSASFMRGQAISSGRTQTQGYIDSNQDAIDQARNAAREQEVNITDEAGKSLTRYAAAQQIANVHTQEFITIQEALQGILDDRIAEDKANPTAQSARAVQMARAGLANAQSQRGIQISQDQQEISPVYGSAATGAKDALNDFVNASRDAAGMMRELVTNTLNGLNTSIVNGLTGGKTNFGQVAKNVGKEALGDGLKKAEGSALSAFGFGGKGQLGTKKNPMVVTIATDTSSSISSAIPNTGASGFFSGLLTSFLPHFANGGQIDGPALVGENGPEIWTPPSGGGQIIPNNKLTSVTSDSGANISYAIDARGTDAVQVEQRVRTAIVASHQSAVSQAVKQVHQQASRRPARSR